VDQNIYGVHPVYLDTRYFTTDQKTKKPVYVATDKAFDFESEYTSYTHGVYLRNAHAQEVLLRSSKLTWRALGGTIDLFIYAGPTADATIRSYQESAVGLPAMQPYYAFGFHQCRWGYTGWEDLQEVVDNFAKFDIPLETIWGRFS
jgi:alpha-glucosidase